MYTKNEDDLSSTSYFLRVYLCQHSTLAEPNRIKPGFVITNDKASYVAKEDSICLFIIAKEAALNKQ
jgi:hypothetical protein